MSVPVLHTVTEAAQILRCSPGFIYDHQLDLGAIKLGRALRIPESGIEDYLLKRKAAALRPAIRRSSFEPLSRVTERRLIDIARRLGR